MRNVLCSSLLREARKLPRDERDAILELVRPSVQRLIDDSLPSSWTAMEAHMELSDAIRAVVGSERNVAIWASTVEVAYGQPLVAGFVTAARKLFAVTPQLTLKHGPRIYHHLTRSVGVLTIEQLQENYGHAVLRAFPVRRYTFDCYVEGLAGALRGGLAPFGLTGSVEVVNKDEERGSARYQVRWK